MDKNFINIDDLARKRLGGGEEREPAGAWQHMQQLLDKEMPQERPPFGFGWRRMFTAVALILLIGSAGVGTYKIAVSFNNDKTAAQPGTPNASAIKAPGAVAATNSPQLPANSRAAAAQVPQNSNAVNSRPVADNSQPLLTAGHITGNKNLSGIYGSARDNMIINNDNSTSGAQHISRTEVATADNGTLPPAGTQNEDAPNVVINNNGRRDENATRNTPGANVREGQAANGQATGKYAATSANTVNDRNTGSDGRVADGSVAGNSNNRQATQGITSGGSNINNAGNNNRTSQSSKAGIADAHGKNTSGTTGQQKAGVREDRSGKTADNRRSADGQLVAGTQGTQAGSRNSGTRHHRTAAMDNTPGTVAHILPGSALGVNTMGTTNPAGLATINTLNGINNEGPEARNITSGDDAKNGKNRKGLTRNGVPVFITQSGKRVPGDKLQRLNMEKARQHKNSNTGVAANTLKSKKVIERMAIVEHFIRTAPNTGFYRIDTVSVVMFTEELGIVTETKTTVPAPKAKSGELNSSTKNKAYADAGDEIVPAARASSGYSTAATSDDLNRKSAGATGALTFENLSAAFNDVKYHMSGMQFAPGIVAGINSTFFGPSNIKGFQFGFAANLVFSDKVSIMTGLMYFHRMNNFSLSDNYYTYTPVNGGYNKELQTNSYSFSTLHSFELPVAVCYTHEKFGFFAGANLAYDMAINTGAATQADPASATFTQAAANDNTPKLKIQDFGARFGVGYLFGISYKVSPNVSLDLRNVQTVWSTGNSDGGQIINSQLYKNPSFQFSFQYHLGGGHND